MCVLNRIQLFVTPWTIARQAPQSMGFLGQEYWSGSPCSPPGDLPDPGIKPTSSASPALAGGFFITWATVHPQLTADSCTGLWTMGLLASRQAPIHHITFCPRAAQGSGQVQALADITSLLGSCPWVSLSPLLLHVNNFAEQQSLKESHVPEFFLRLCG